MNLEMRNLLAQASVVAEASASSADKPPSHAKPGGQEPRSTGRSLYDRILDRFTAAATPRQETRAIAWAHHELARSKRRPQMGLTADQDQFWKLQSVQGSGGMDYRRAAERSGLTDKQVWALRKKAGVDPRNGLPLVKAA